MTHGLVEGQPRARALFTQNPGFMRQLFQAGTAALGQWVLWRAEHHQFVLDPGLHLDIRVLAVAFDQAQVQLVVGDLLHHMSGVMHLQFHPAFRVVLHEAANQQGGQIVAHGQGGADVQRAITALAPQQAFDFARLVDQGHGLGQ